MKKNSFLSLIILSIFLFNCSDKSSNPTISDESANTKEVLKLFPAEVGKSFVYNVDSYDASGSNYVNLGQRTMHIDKIEADLISCTEVYNYLQSLSLDSKIKITNNTLEFLADNEGASNLIPDSLAGQVQLELDEYFKVLQLPLVLNTSWDVYKAKALFGTFKFNVFGLTAKYLGSEAIQMEGFNETLNTEKIEYTININIPDMANLFANNLQTYKATVWIVPNIGIVKIEGCSLFVNPITGNNFDMSDSNKVIRHTLVP